MDFIFWGIFGEFDFVSGIDKKFYGEEDIINTR
jgi:hypothetical protein